MNILQLQIIMSSINPFLYCLLTRSRVHCNVIDRVADRMQGGDCAALEGREMSVRRGGGRREEMCDGALMRRRRLRRHSNSRWLGVALVRAAEMVVAVRMVWQRAGAAFM